MNPHTEEAPRIGPVSPENRTEALKLVFNRLIPEDRRRQLDTFLADTPKGGEPLLLGAHRHGRLVGAVLSQIQPGRTAAVWPPRVVKDEPTTTAAKLLSAACQRLAHRHVCIAQVLLRCDTSADVANLLEQGFQRLAKLFYMVSTEDQFPDQPPAGPLAFELYEPGNHARLAGVVEDTYSQTRDCPRLDGVRQIEDVLAGYRATGVFDPTRWSIVRHGNRDVGCLLLADHPEDGNYELVYMGLAVSARGRGWGTHVARQAQWQTRQAGRPRLVLAVDADNQPALTIYSAVGFRAWDRRVAYVKVFSPSG